MYEMQGPHVAWQRADLPIPRLTYALPGVPPYPQPWRYPVPRVPHNPRVAPGVWTALQVVSDFLLPQAVAAQEVFVNLFKILL
jgi:hypothetical protein